MQLNFYEVLSDIHARSSAELIDLSTGKPIIPTYVTEAVAAAVVEASRRSDFAHLVSDYVSLDGEPGFLQLITDVLSSCFGRRVTESEVLIVPGCQVALNLVLSVSQTQCRPLFWPAPYEFPGAVDWEHAELGAQPFIRTIRSDGIVHLDLDIPECGVAERCIVLLSHPHNPTGTLWSTVTLTKLANKCCLVGGWLVLDQTYAFPWAPLCYQQIEFIDHPNVVHLFSFSKVGLAGERLGLVVGSSECIATLRFLLRRLIIQSPKLAQILGARLIEIYTRNPQLSSVFGETYRANWRFTADALLAQANYPGGRIAEWGGGPFLWFEWESSGPDEYLVFKDVLSRGVAIMPGGALATPGAEDPVNALRIGLGTEPDVLKRAIERMIPVLQG